MKAVVYTKTGGLEVVKQQSVETPLPGDDQVLIKVKACALNVSDYQRFQTKNGKIPFFTSLTNTMMGYIGKPLGAEISGIVVKTGKNVTHVKKGDAVFGKTAGSAPAGGLAELALMASFTSHNFTYYAGAFTKQDDYLQYAKELAESEKLHTYIDKVYSVNETVDAIQYLLTSHAQGKVVIKTDF